MFTWSASGCDRRDRFDAWVSTLNATHLPWQMNDGSASFSEAEITSLDTGPATFVNCRCDPCAGSRDAKTIRTSDDGLYGVLAVRKGRERVRQGDVACELRPGDLMIWDAAHPIDFEVIDVLEKSTLFIAKDQLARIAGTSRLPLGRLESGRGFGALLFERMRVASGLIEDFKTDGAERLGLALTQDLLNVVPTPRAKPVISARQALRQRALRMIEQKFEDYTFTPGSMAEELGVSLRTLHKAFEDHEDTVAGRLRSHRLKAVKSDLRNPELRHCSITQISFARGFNSSEHFSRLFRAEYGVSPRVYRRKHLARESRIQC
ncbi:MAG: helix-turn-helix domain-containing protein [Pseudomonadota bacterium]